MADRTQRDSATQQNETQGCSDCLGWGIDLEKAQPSLAMPGMNAYIASMYPCPTCNGRPEAADYEFVGGAEKMKDDLCSGLISDEDVERMLS